MRLHNGVFLGCLVFFAFACVVVQVGLIPALAVDLVREWNLPVPVVAIAAACAIAALVCAEVVLYGLARLSRLSTGRDGIDTPALRYLALMQAASLVTAGFTLIAAATFLIGSPAGHIGVSAICVLSVVVPLALWLVIRVARQVLAAAIADRRELAAVI
ncbi:hypothetical protein H8R18_06805 [Nanchangia anserum]|uniref:DUF2975 domain-containing protein n=1 Tax=Nanchangia anserum TaxID=2692125 RepID=A0A8I0KNF9_9ACTO|nr:DUF2975 domain-containing protein [Nanchangia anserum]MBD3689241.1 hypothetical protein [Nanchangia anserum]QOX81463.1 hypothetical protein H8R18_06805 [Nanchangia anserum]